MNMVNNFKKYSMSDIGDYYNQSMKLYSWFWFDKDSLAMHFGYWDKNTKNKKDSLVNTYREIINILKPKAGDVLLDSGCGVGGAAFWIARNTKAKVVGITISKKQIETVKELQKTAKADVADRTSFYYMDYTKTSFGNNSFDGIFGVESFCYCYPDMGSLFKEMYRILKKGGKIVMIDGFLHRYPKDQKEKFLLQKLYQGWKLSGGLTPPEILEQFKKAGFKKAAFIDKTKAIGKTGLLLYFIGIIGYFPFKLLHLCGLISDVVFENLYPIIHQRKLRQLGIMGHGIFYAEK